MGCGCCCGKKTILIVDDDADARVFVETMVTDIDDFNILTADNGDTALKTAAENKPDLIIMDVMMPEKDGFETFMEMRQNAELADIPIIMLTGVSSQTGIKVTAKDMKEYMGTPAAAFLDKPVDPGQLQDTVKKVLCI